MIDIEIIGLLSSLSIKGSITISLLLLFIIGLIFSQVAISAKTKDAKRKIGINIFFITPPS